MKVFHIPALALLALGVARPVDATTYSVGPAGGCTHVSLESAINDAVVNALDGPHTIKLRTGELMTGGLTIDRPATDIIIEGGYDTCAAGTPTPGARMTVRQITPSRVFDMDGGGASDVPRRTVTLKNLRVTGGSIGPGQIGGGIRVSGKLELRLAGGTEVSDNSAGDGGGIGMISVATLDGDKPRLLVDEDASVAENLASRFGGGIYVVGGASVLLLDGSVDNNIAQRRGGGIYLGGTGTDLRIQTFDNAQVSIDENWAGTDTFTTTDGLGGAIYSDKARVLADTTGSPGRHMISLSGNRANYGGAIYALGAIDGTFTFIELRDSIVSFNYGRGKGGAFYSRNAVDWIITHDSSGPCFANLVGLVPCSLVYRNAAGNHTTPDTPGGGVFYLASDTGSPRGIARVRRTLLDGNMDIDGRAAIIEATAANEYFIERSIIVGNSATGGGGNFATLLRSDTANSWLLYSTILENEVDRLFVFGGTTLTVTGSIFWAPGTPIWSQPATAMVHGDCLISHSSANIPAGANLDDPLLDASGRPRNGSDAWDWCWGTVTNDADGRAPHDIAGVANAHGINDLGAYEQADVVFTHGMGSYPDN